MWDATPEERAREFEARYAVGGFCLHAAYADLFDDQASNDLLAEFLRAKIRERVEDPETAEVLCPYDHPVGTKRMCVDTDYFETYNRPNVRSSRSARRRSTRLRRPGCASPASSSRSTRSCSARASTP